MTTPTHKGTPSRTRNAKSQSSARTTSSRTSSARARSHKSDSQQSDILKMLADDHEKVDGLFEDFESSADEDDETKGDLVASICNELTIHSALEEQLFYPAAREALDESKRHLLDEAEVEHGSVKDLITELSAMRPSDALFHAKVKVLAEYVRHHVKEEEGEIFPALRRTDLDRDELARQATAFKSQARGEIEAPAPLSA